MGSGTLFNAALVGCTPAYTHSSFSSNTPFCISQKQLSADGMCAILRDKRPVISQFAHFCNFSIEQPLVSICSLTHAMLPLAAAAGAAKRRRLSQKVAPYGRAFRTTLGDETANAVQCVYLITISRVLSDAAANYRDIRELSRQEVCNMVRDAFDNPAASQSGAGRPRAGDQQSVVKFVAVAQESHEDGSPHFHVVVRLNTKMRWGLAMHTLRTRHRVPSHWSCSHSQLWSTLRYIVVATPKKPIVDEKVLVWSESGKPVDLVAMSLASFFIPTFFCKFLHGVTPDSTFDKWSRDC